MSWEAITAISTAVTTVVLLGTVILGRHQLELLRNSTQLDGVFRILRQIRSAENDEARRFVLEDLEKSLLDPEFARQVREGSGGYVDHRERAVLALYEEVGAYLKFTLVDSDFLYCQAGSTALNCWKKLRPVVAADRKRRGPKVWDAYELFVEGTVAYAKRQDRNFDLGFEISPDGFMVAASAALTPTP